MVPLVCDGAVGRPHEDHTTSGSRPGKVPCQPGSAQGQSGCCRVESTSRLALEALQVAVMDPYQILGLSRGCTRDEVENAFRVGVWHARPDRGGADDPFIELSTAYRRILEELDRGSGSGVRNPEGVPRMRDPRSARPRMGCRADRG